MYPFFNCNYKVSDIVYVKILTAHGLVNTVKTAEKGVGAKCAEKIDFMKIKASQFSMLKLSS